jgi:hypothetical protein
VQQEKVDMPQSIGDRLRQQARTTFIGRKEELAQLLAAFEPHGPLVTFVYGLGGIGKSTLLHALAEAAQVRDITPLVLDCRAISPSEAGLIEALGALLHLAEPTLATVAAALAGQPGGVLLALDGYELFRLLDTWLRQCFVPALPDSVRLFFVGREAPVAAWLTTPGWQGLVRTLRLGPLTEAATITLLRTAGVPADAVERLRRFAGGHPLALKLAAAALAERPDLTLAEIEARHVIDGLARIYLHDVRDPVTRQALEAASVVRRVTRSVLAVMLPAVDAGSAYDQLGELPFVESAADGLIIHDLVRQAIESWLRASDPSRHRAYRVAAWRQLRAELERAPRPHLWRYTADTIYLIENRAVRDAFFPQDAPRFAVEQANRGDGAQILAMTARHCGPVATAQIEQWWRLAPELFQVARNGSGRVVGYYILCLPGQVNSLLARQDPIIAHWLEHLRTSPIPADQRVLFCRQMLAEEGGEGYSEVQAACWLDVKRAYLANPQLRRIYTTTRAPALHLPVVSQLGFVLVPQLCARIDGQIYDTLLNDFGPTLVFGWMANLVDAQYGGGAPPVRLDPEAHEVVLANERLALTPLEFGVLHLLTQRPGKPVTRVDLLEEVWGYEYDGGSNVVDSIIRSLRKKLGDYAAAIETVTGVGYRFRGFGGDEIRALAS